MNWDQQLIKACTETDGTPHPHTDHVLTGAKWMRDQLRTDEAVEMVARELYIRDFIDREKGERRWAKLGDGKRYHLQHARAAITALLGDTP